MLGNPAVGMNHLTEQVSDLIAVRESTWRADIACHQYLTVFDDDAAATATVAGGAFRHGVGKVQEIVVPGGADMQLGENLFHFPMQLRYGAVVVEHKVGLTDAFTKVLLVGY